jgi:hypothetical protein
MENKDTCIIKIPHVIKWMVNYIEDNEYEYFMENKTDIIPLLLKYYEICKGKQYDR